jgi:hypothetical protein
VGHSLLCNKDDDFGMLCPAKVHAGGGIEFATFGLVCGIKEILQYLFDLVDIVPIGCTL